MKWYKNEYFKIDYFNLVSNFIISKDTNTISKNLITSCIYDHINLFTSN